MPDFGDYIAFAEHLLRGRYGTWLNQPDLLDVCTLNDSCDPLIWTSPYELRKATLKWTRTPAPTSIPQDAAMCTFHFLNLTGGDPDASWIAADYTAAETKLLAFWGAIKSYYTAATKLAEISWCADGPAFTPHGTSPHPTLRATAVSVAGSGTDLTLALPPQTAISVTEVTSAKYTVLDVEGVGTQLRNRWGRFYLPAPTIDAINAGRVSSSVAEAIATAAQTLYNSTKTAECPIVMYSPTTGNSWSVDELHVDDIFDVIRSRRFEGVVDRHIKVLT